MTDKNLEEKISIAREDYKNAVRIYWQMVDDCNALRDLVISLNDNYYMLLKEKIEVLEKRCK